MINRFDKTCQIHMQNLGNVIRKLRDDRKLPLKIVALSINIDQAILSKIERGQRNATRDQVIKLSDYFKANQNELLTIWLSEKLVLEVRGEDIALSALKQAEEIIKQDYKIK